MCPGTPPIHVHCVIFQLGCLQQWKDMGARLVLAHLS
eukprot:SAG11_NODE_30195_length_303_cov_0.759804_1_plen_36_part_10